MSDTDKGFTPPVTEELSQKTTDKANTTATQGVAKPAATPTPEKKPDEDLTFTKKEVEGTVIGLKAMTNSKGNATTDIIAERIEKHIGYLSGKVGFENKEAQNREQQSFIETVGNSLKLDFEQYVLVTDKLLEVIRENDKVFREGLAFRFMKNLGENYPLESVKAYQSYITYLTKIAFNWSARHRLHELTDPTYVIQNLDRKGKENVIRYFNMLRSS